MMINDLSGGKKGFDTRKYRSRRRKILINTDAMLTWPHVGHSRAIRFIFLQFLFVRFSCLFFARFILVDMSSSGYSLEPRIQQKQWKKLRKPFFYSPPFAFSSRLFEEKSSRGKICLHSDILFTRFKLEPRIAAHHLAEQLSRLRWIIIASTMYTLKTRCFICT